MHVRCLDAEDFAFGLGQLAWNVSVLAGDVNDAQLTSAGTDAANWITHGRDLAATRFAPSKEITTGNVKRLRPAFIYQTGTAASSRQRLLSWTESCMCRRRSRT